MARAGLQGHNPTCPSYSLANLPEAMAAVASRAHTQRMRELRERIATAVLGHYLAATSDGELVYGTQEAVERSLIAADLLIKELNK